MKINEIEINKYQKKDEISIKKFIVTALEEIFVKTNVGEWENFEDYEIFYIAKDKEEVIGTIALKKENNSAILKRMYIAKSYRNNGLGQRLFNIILDFCNKEGYKEINLSTTPEMKPAISFYKKNGFMLKGEDKNKNQLFFIKNLENA